MGQAIAIAVAFGLAFRRDLGEHAQILALAMLGGFVAGFHLGRLASYGRLGWACAARVARYTHALVTSTEPPV